MIEYERMETLGQNPLVPERIKEATDFFYKHRNAFYSHAELQDILNFAELHPELFNCVMIIVKQR
jgi:hypothetical protein